MVPLARGEVSSPLAWPVDTVVAVALVVLFRAVAADVSNCTRDTFGMAGEGWPKPFEKGVEELRCRLRHTDASQLPFFTLIYYPSTEHFRDFNGTDMVPERHSELNSKLKRKTLRWVLGRNGPVAQTRKIQVAECDIPTNDDDGSTYTIQRVGPLVSTGNYDYWQFGWKDVWRLSRPLREHKELMFTSSFSGPVDPKGRILGHPPIHIHHIHITPMPGVVTKMHSRSCVSGLDPTQCYVANLAVEQHGDYQCTEEDGGLDCFFEQTAHGHAKVVNTPLDLEGEINDVRAPDSEPMIWWYQVVLRWFPKTPKYKVLSQHFIVGPGMFNEDDQRHNVLVFPVDTKRPSMYWYSGRMEHEGEMARNKLHSHNTMFDRAFFFRASPRDLGLDDPQFWPNISYRPLLLENLSLTSFDALQTHVLAKLAAAAERYDTTCRSPRCGHGRPALVCQSWVSNEEFVDPISGSSFAYDRRAPCCCRPWNFRVGDVFTVLAFMAPMRTPPGPWTPHFTPPTANMHIHWLMSYRTSDNQSHYRQTVFTQDAQLQVEYPEDLSRYPLWNLLGSASYGEGGLRNEPMAPRQKLWVGMLWLAAISIAFWREVVGGMLFWMALLSLLALHFLLRLRRLRHHRVVKCVEAVPCQPEVVQVARDCCQDPDVVQHDD